MARIRQFLTTLALAGGSAVMAFAPLAHAAPPEGLAETPIGEIYTLVGEGYDVQMHWDAGQPADVPLALCTVTGVDESAKPTATISVSCPAKVS